MKKLTLSLCVFIYSIGLYGQIVDIPDANFLAALIEEGVDSNGDGLIQNIEAEAVDTLDIREYEIASLEGINAFNNLKLLFASKNNLTSLDLNLPLLIYLGCEHNELISIELSALPNLEYLYCRENMLTSLDLTELPLLRYLSCGNNELTSLDVSSLPLLSYLKCAYNQLTSLDVTSLTNLTDIGCALNNISKLDVRSHPMLETLLCVGNNMDTLKLGSHPFLSLISCGENRISSLKLDSLPALKTLTCGENWLTSIDISGHPLLETFYCDVNLLRELKLKDLPLLRSVICTGNRMKSLDFTNLPSLSFLRFGNSDLEYVNLLDDNYPQLQVIGNLEELKFLCADSLEIDFLEGEIDLSNVIINEYCLEDYDCFVNVSGMSSYGSTSECLDGVPVSNTIEIEIVMESGQSFIHYPTESTYTIKIPPNNQTTIQVHNLDADLFNVEPEVYNINTNVDIDSVDFCISPTENLVTNVCLASYTLDSPSSGFVHSYTIDYTNLGNVTVNGFLGFEYDPEIMHLIESSDDWTPFSGVLGMSFFGLLPLEKRTSTLTFLLNSAMDDPALVEGEHLLVHCTLFTDENDVVPQNNFTTLNETVVSSSGTNDKTCLQGNAILKDSLGSPIKYRIRFENTGSTLVQNITIRDTVDTNVFDINSIQLLGSSSPVNLNVRGNVIDFQFININLSVDDEFNDGYVIFSLNALDELVVGTKIENKASIYFDFNWPFDTNVASSEIVEDADQDGFHNLEDCDDTNADINPGQLEEPYNGVDDDCDESTLDDDLDQDGFAMIDDCDDSNPDVNPDEMEEPYNGIDDDCDEITLDDDLDQDGFILAEDCDDANPDINPDAEEIANNGIDEDCDGMDLVTAIHELSNHPINIYPNPARDYINIDLDGDIEYKVSIYNLEGKLVLTALNSSTIQIRTLLQGVYILEIKDLATGQKVIEKVVKRN